METYILQFRQSAENGIANFGVSKDKDVGIRQDRQSKEYLYVSDLQDTLQEIYDKAESEEFNDLPRLHDQLYRLLMRYQKSSLSALVSATLQPVSNILVWNSITCLGYTRRAFSRTFRRPVFNG